MGKIRDLRMPRGTPGTLARELGFQVDRISRQHRALGTIGEQWGSLVPADLASRVWPESWQRGMLTVRAGDAAAGFEFDRWLRGGGEGALRRAGVRRVRVAPSGA